MTAATGTGSALELTLAVVSVLVALGGFYIAYLFYHKKPGMAAALAGRHRIAFLTLKNKYWVDEIYNSFLVLPLLMFTRGVLELLFERGVVRGSAERWAWGRGVLRGCPQADLGQHSLLRGMARDWRRRRPRGHDFRPVAVGAPHEHWITSF